MPGPQVEPPVVEPEVIAEVLCIGKFNLVTNGPLGPLTFTHVRPKAEPLLDRGALEFESVVRARITTTVENLASLRDLITSVLEAAPGQPTAPRTGGGTLN